MMNITNKYNPATGKDDLVQNEFVQVYTVRDGITVYEGNYTPAAAERYFGGREDVIRRREDGQVIETDGRLVKW